MFTPALSLRSNRFRGLGSKKMTENRIFGVLPQCEKWSENQKKKDIDG